MLITELISKLEDLRELVGNVPVEVRNEAGEFNDAETAEIVNVSRDKNKPKWATYIDV